MLVHFTSGYVRSITDANRYSEYVHVPCQLAWLIKLSRHMYPSSLKHHRTVEVSESRY